MSDVQRYGLDDYGEQYVIQADNGRFVEFDDYAALLAEHEALLRRVAEAPVVTHPHEDHGALLKAAHDAGYFSGQRVRILAEPGEVGS